MAGKKPLKISDPLVLVRSSNVRKHILESTRTYPKSPTDLQKETGVKMSNLTDELDALEQAGLIALRDAQARKGKLYQLTPKGEEILTTVLESEQDTLQRMNARLQATEKDDIERIRKRWSAPEKPKKK